MISALQHDAALYTSFLSNGIYINLIVADFTRKHADHLFWRTSYPMLDFLYPYWWQRADLAQNDDFWWEALKMAGGLFHWELTSSGKSLKLPYSGYGSGISGAYIVTAEDAKVQPHITLQPNIFSTPENTVSLVKAFSPYLEHFNDKVIFVNLNFSHIDVIEFIPKTVGMARRWEHKVTHVRFQTQQEFLERILTKRFMPFTRINY